MYPSIEHNKVWFNKDVHLCVTSTYTGFCTWHTMLNVFHLVYTRIFIDNYPTTLFILSQNANVWVVWVLSRGVGLWVQSKMGHRWDWFIIYHEVWHVLIELKVNTTTCRSFFLFLHSVEYYECYKMSCIVHHTLVWWCTNAALERWKCRDWCAVRD